MLQLLDVGFGDLLLLGSGVENRGPVLRADVGTLAVELRGIVRDVEEDLQHLSVGDFAGIVGDLYGFGVAGSSGAHDVIVSGRGIAAGVPGDHLFHAFDLLEDGLDAPEATASQHGRLRPLGGDAGRDLVIDDRIGERRRAQGDSAEDRESQRCFGCLRWSRSSVSPDEWLSFIQ